MGVSTTPTHSYRLYLATAVNIYLEKHFTLSPEQKVFSHRDGIIENSANNVGYMNSIIATHCHRSERV